MSPVPCKQTANGSSQRERRDVIHALSGVSDSISLGVTYSQLTNGDSNATRNQRSPSLTDSERSGDSDNCE